MGKESEIESKVFVIESEHCKAVAMDDMKMPDPEKSKAQKFLFDNLIQSDSGGFAPNPK